MSASGFTPIQLYRSSTAATLPVAGNLAPGELAINTTDEKLYFENTGGTVTLLASSAAAGGTFTTVTATTVVNGLGAVGTPSYTFTGDLNTGMWSPAADTVAVSTAGAERLRVTSAGNVGIGTTTPSYALDVSATGNISGQFKTSGSINALYLADAGTTAGTLYVGTVGNDFRVVTGSNEHVRVTSAGLVGIGTSSPSAKLNVAGDTIISGNADARQIGFNFYGTSQYNFYVDGAVDAARMTIRRGTTSVATFDSSGNVGIGDSAPGYRLVVKPNAFAGGTALVPAINIIANGGATGGNTSQGAIAWETPAGARVAAISPFFDDPSATFRTSMAFFTSDLGGTNLERMRINSDGNVGIGTTAPTSRLTVTSGQFTSPALNIIGAGPNQGWLRLGNNADIKGGDDLLGLTFTVGASERMRIDGSGNVLVGTTSDAGVATNTAKIIGGVHATVRSSLSVASATPTTIVTLPSGDGIYIVSTALSASTDPANYNETAIVSISGSTSSIAILVNASVVSLTMSGLNLQVTQNQGATQTMQFSVLRIL